MNRKRKIQTRRDFILKTAKITGAVGAALMTPYIFASDSQAKVTSVKLNKRKNGYLSFTFTLDQKPEYKVFSLSKPDRIVIDLKNTGLSGKLGLGSKPNKLVEKLRHAVRNESDLRIVLDLANSASHTSSLKASKGAYLLTVDLKPGAKKADSKPKQTQKAKPAKEKPVTKKPRKGDFIVAIDAGHGGKDPGAVGKRGTKEKDVVLKIARKLKARVDRQRGMHAVLIRDGDYYVPLKRIEIAHNKKADIFISIHADANNNPRLAGSSVYILSEDGASSDIAQFLADSENSYESKLSGVNLHRRNKVLASVLVDLAKAATIDTSLQLAKGVLGELKHVNRLLRRRVESAGFIVLKSPDIPSMLVETSFISNPAEEKRLRTSAYQQKMADAIFSGIKRFHIAQVESGALKRA